MINQKFDLKDQRVVLNPNFKKNLFTSLLKNYGRHKLANKLNISSSMLYHYKNNRVSNLSMLQFKRCLKLASIDFSQVEPFVEKTFSLKERTTKILKQGQDKRHMQLKNFREDIPAVDKFVSNNSLNFKIWFDSYLKLLEVGPRKVISVQEKGNVLTIAYSNYVKGKNKEYKVHIPQQIDMNDDFCHFFGLWCGDRTGGGRIGVVNKEKEINKFTIHYLQKLYQHPRTVILKSSRVKKLPALDIEFDSIQEVKGMPGTFVPMVFAINGILKQFFFYLDAHLGQFLELVPNRNAFFAGLFDAEGNVFLEDRCFRWACKDTRKVEIYSGHLTQMGLFRRYDGSNLVCYNKYDFGRSILPYLKHPQKINDTRLVCFGKGKLNERFLNILNTVKANNGSEIKILAKALKRVKLHAQVKVLERLGYVESIGYPKKIYITSRGLAERKSQEGRKHDNSDSLLSVAVNQ